MPKSALSKLAPRIDTVDQQPTALAALGVPRPSFTPAKIPLNQMGLEQKYARDAWNRAPKDGESEDVWDPATGELVLKKDAVGSGIAYTPDERARMKSMASVHSHPGGGVPSPSDLLSAQREGLGKLMVVGDRYIYSVEPLQGGNFGPDQGDVRQVYDQVQADAFRRHRNEDADWITIGNEVMQEVAKRMGLKYLRTEK